MGETGELSRSGMVDMANDGKQDQAVKDNLVVLTSTSSRS